MKTIFYISCCLIAFMLILSGCQEEISLDLTTDSEQVVAVDGRLVNTSEVQNIRLTLTQSYFDSTMPAPVLDADVRLVAASDETTIPLTLTHADSGIYSTATVACEIGETYTLQVEYNGGLYEAEAYLDTVPRIDAVNYLYELESYFGFTYGYYSFYINFNEPAPSGDYYMLKVYLNDVLYTQEVSEAIYLSDFQMDGQYWANVELGFTFPQEDIVSDTNRVRFEMFSISEDELDYLNAFVQEVYANGSIFSGPPANIPTNLYNLSGGADGVGFFSASAKTSYELYLYKEHDESTNSPF
jgi:hypothetical protein